MFCVLCVGARAHAQWAIPWQMRGEATIDHLLNPGVIAKPDLSYGTVTASAGSITSYVDLKWNNSSFLLYDQERFVEGYLAKYDLKTNTVMVRTKSAVRAIDANKIKSIVWVDSLTHAPRYFVNAREYKDESVQMTGLLEVLVEGQVPLYAQSYLSEKEIGFFASVLALFEKEKHEKKYEVKKYFYSGGGNALSKITTKKELLLSFGDFYWEMEEYIQKNKLDINMQSGLQKTFEHYNAKFERLPDY